MKSGLYLVIAIIAVLAVSSVFSYAFAYDGINDNGPLYGKINYDINRQFPDCSAYGGDPNGDGICAHWKDGTYGSGLHIDFTNSTNNVHYRYDLSCTPGYTIANDSTGLQVCPSTSKKDIYVELDCMKDQCPSSQAVADVVTAFYNHGVQLHVQMGENPTTGSGDIGVHYCNIKMTTTDRETAGVSCSKSSQYFQSYPFLKQNFFGTTAERQGSTTYCPLNGVPSGVTPSNSASAYNCLTAKRQVFHYGMFVDYQLNYQGSSGWSEVWGNDFLISMGNFSNNGVGSLDEQEGAFMHELGHNLGLNHGGVIDANNCKPNYLSVMNYAFMFQENGDSCRPLDYSNSTLATLNEGSLTDSNIGDSYYPSGSSCQGERKIFWSGPTGTTLSGNTGTTEDWNHDGINSTATYSQIVNNLGTSCTASQTPITLTGFNDWAFILNGNTTLGYPEPLNFRPSQNFYATILPSGNIDSDFVPGQEHSDYPLTLIPLQNTTTQISSSSYSVTQGSAVTLTVTVTSNGASPTTPTGTVAWSDGGAGGTFNTDTCSLSSGSCSVVYTTSANAPGSLTISASYGADTAHTGSTATSPLSTTGKTTVDYLAIFAICLASLAIVIAIWRKKQ